MNRGTIIGAAVVLGAAVLVAGSLRGDDRKGPAKDIPAEKYFKNIQAFRGLPSTDLMGAMSYMAAALGTRCEHCHVTTEKGNWPMEKDDKAAKRRAREMIAMVKSINASNFDGKLRVTCATCHHGQTTPPDAPPLRVDDSPTTGDPAAGAAALPSVDAVFAKYLAAAGGREALSRITTREIRGTAASGGERFAFELRQKAPNKSLVVTTFANGETLSRGYDGEIGWDRGAHEGGRMGEDELVQMRRRAVFSLPLDLRNRYATLAVTGREMVAGREAVIVAGRAMDGNRERLDFDAESGLLVRRTTIVDTVLGPIPDQTDLLDYREIGGEEFPFTLLRVGPNFRETQSYSEVRQNVPVDDAVFTMPKMP
jgi:hypothetical protein